MKALDMFKVCLMQNIKENKAESSACMHGALGVVDIVSKSEIHEKIHAALQPDRFKILEFLNENPDTHIAEIARKMSLHRSTVAYHLGLLENLEVVKSKYVILEEPHSVGKAGRVYRINEEEIIEISKAIAKRLSEFQE